MIHLTGHKSAVRGLAYSPDGLTLASASMDSTVRLWDVAAGVVRTLIQTRFSGALCVAYSRDGQSMVIGHRGGAVEWFQLSNREQTNYGQAHSTDVRNVRFDTDSDYLLFSQADDVLYQELPLAGHYDEAARIPIDSIVSAMDIDHQHRMSFLLENGEIWRQRFWKHGNATMLTRGFIAGGRGDLKCRPRSDGLAMTSGNFIGLWSGRKNELPRTWRAHNAEVSQLAFLPDGSGLLSAGLDGTVRSWDLDSLSERAAFDFGIGECFSIAVAPDGLTAAVGGLTDIVLWDLTD